MPPTTALVIDPSERGPAAPPARPRLFIASSGEGRAVAECIQLEMDDTVEGTIGWQGVFGRSTVPLASLERVARSTDFAVVVATPDDVTTKHGQPTLAPRASVVFELGLFVGALGRSRTFLVCQKSTALALPTDLEGVTVASFTPRADGNLQAALGPACTRLKLAIRQTLKSMIPSTLDTPTTRPERDWISRRRRRRSLGIASIRTPEGRHHIVNVSVSGALLETDREIPVGQLLELDLDLGNGVIPGVTARVVRVQQPRWGAVGGVGITFTDLADATRKLIGEYVSAEQEG